MSLRAGLLLALLANAVVGQETAEQAEDNWYRIELLILANRDPEAALAERWPLLPQLAYPPAWQHLDTGPTRWPASQPFELVTVEDSAPSAALDLFWGRSIEELLREYQLKQLLAKPPSMLEEQVDTETSLDVPRQRALLPADARELNSQRRRIDNSAGLDVLVHQSWLQRIPARDVALPLIFDGPVESGDYPELQGSILFYSGRYLHIATDLWLNTAGSYLDENPATAGWTMPPPPLPMDQSEPPLRPFRVAVDTHWLAELDGTTVPSTAREAERRDSGETVDHGSPAFTAGTAGMGEGNAVPEGVTTTPGDDNRLDTVAVTASAEPAPIGPVTIVEAAPRDRSPAAEQQIPALMAQPPLHDYEFRHAVRVTQQRRMRSDELHYIDHPLLGIVVKVSRYKFLPFSNLDESTEN